jgi:CBS domain-containing protein
MIEEPVCCRADDDIHLVAKIMKDTNVGFLPVVTGTDRVLRGVVTDRDICLKMVAEAVIGSRTAAEIMTHDPVVCRAGDTIEHALITMKNAHVRRLPVINEENRLIGVVSFEDIVRSHAVEDEKICLELEQIFVTAKPRHALHDPTTIGALA